MLTLYLHRQYFNLCFVCASCEF